MRAGHREPLIGRRALAALTPPWRSVAPLNHKSVALSICGVGVSIWGSLATPAPTRSEEREDNQRVAPVLGPPHKEEPHLVGIWGGIHRGPPRWPHRPPADDIRHMESQSGPWHGAEVGRRPAGCHQDQALRKASVLEARSCRGRHQGLFPLCASCTGCLPPDVVAAAWGLMCLLPPKGGLFSDSTKGYPQQRKPTTVWPQLAFMEQVGSLLHGLNMSSCPLRAMGPQEAAGGLGRMGVKWSSAGETPG